MVSKKTSTVLLSALAGSFVGAFIVIIASSYYYTQFFTDTTARATAANLMITVQELESLRAGDTAGAIEKLESEVKTGLISFGAIRIEKHPNVEEKILDAISRAKKYVGRYPIKAAKEEEMMLIEKALKKVE